MTAPLQVLVTGSAGRIGRATANALRERGHRVRGFDRVANADLGEQVLGDLSDRAAVARAMEGTECLIHLAATPDEDDVLAQLVPNNIVGLFHVMEAAREAGVRRIILASSGQVNWWQQMRAEVPIRATDPVTPKAWYAATKMFMESIGRSFAETHGTSVIVARLGWCPRTREQVREIEAADWAQDIYLSPNDCGRFFACAVDAPPEMRFAILYANSRPIHRARFDLTEAERLIGYIPQERWPVGIEVVD